MIGTLLRSIGWRPTEKEVQVYQSRLKRSYQETHCELGDVMAFLDMTPNPRVRPLELMRVYHGGWAWPLAS